MKKFLAALLVTIAPWAALAQPTQALQQGQDFAKQIQPTTPSQIFNPAGLSWPTPATMPTTAPSGLRAFSNPISGNATMQDARGMGLLQLGNNTLNDICNVKTVTTSWNDACKPFADSPGSPSHLNDGYQYENI